jgi:hypothetical protein
LFVSFSFVIEMKIVLIFKVLFCFSERKTNRNWVGMIKLYCCRQTGAPTVVRNYFQKILNQIQFLFWQFGKNPQKFVLLHFNSRMYCSVNLKMWNIICNLGLLPFLSNLNENPCIAWCPLLLLQLQSTVYDKYLNFCIFICKQKNTLIVFIYITNNLIVYFYKSNKTKILIILSIQCSIE